MSQSPRVPFELEHERRARAQIGRQNLEGCFREVLAKAGGKVSPLAKELGIDRRKLTSLLQGENPKFSLQEVFELVDYIEARGLPVFQPPRLTTELTESGQVVFAVPTYPRESRRSDVNLWDLEAVDRLSNELRRFRGVSVDIGYIQQPNDSDKIDRVEEHLRSETERWLTGKGRTVIAIGSPRACLLAEQMLCRFWQLPTLRGREGLSRKTPFAFIWPPIGGAGESHAALQWESTFAMQPVNISPSAHTIHPQRFEYREPLGFRLGEHVYIERDMETSTSPPRRESMGVIAARRLPDDQIWLVLAGTTGPATAGGVSAMRRIPELVNCSIGPNCGDGFWAVVKTTIHEDRSIKVGENRRTGDVALVDGPNRFSGPV